MLRFARCRPSLARFSYSLSLSLCFALCLAADALAGRLEFSYRLSEADVTVEYDEREGVHRISLRDEQPFAAPGWEGAPLLPALHRTMLLPPDTRVSGVTVVTADPMVIAENVVPDFIRRGDASGEEEERDPYWYEEGYRFPPDPAFLMGNGSYRGLCLGDVAAMPLEWDSETGDLILYRSVEVLLDYTPSNEVPKRLRRDRRFSRRGYELSWVRDHVVNPGGLSAYQAGGWRPVEQEQGLSVTERNPSNGFHPTDRPSTQGPAIDMVIVTGTEWADGTPIDGDMVEAWQELADWKTVTGTPTVVRTVQWIRENYPGHDDPARIRAFLRDAYEKWSTDFVLLGGDDKVVPARLFTVVGGNLNDYPTQWWYASLETDFDATDLESEYSEPGLSDVPDKYPELWVGRVPVRDAQEALDFATKLRTYEHEPDRPRPSSHYYKSFLSASGLTNSGKMDDLGASLSNGLAASELMLNDVFEPNGFSFTRLYPEIPHDEVNCGGSEVLRCWGQVEDYFQSPNFYPTTRMTREEMRDSLDAGYAYFFHVEHSDFDHLGGPSTGVYIEFLQRYNVVNYDECDEDAPSCTNCQTWYSACLQAYILANSIGSTSIGQGVDREIAETLTNGPEYSVGASFGSRTGRHEMDSIAERLVRAPQGGAICMANKPVSYATSPEIPIDYFTGIVDGGMPPGVALPNANASPELYYNSVLIWHFFGDPSMQAWTEEPGVLAIATAPDSIVFGGVRSVTVTVTSASAPVPDILVTLTRDDDIYVIGQTDSGGEVTFPAIPFLTDDANVTIWASGRNYEPATDSLLVNFHGNVNPFHPLVYEDHTWTDTGGRVSDLLEAGDEVELGVRARNRANQEISGGTAALVASPRVRATLRRDDGVDLLPVVGTDVFLGEALAHPPAFADTFDFAVNELGIRPEGEPGGSLDDDAVYIWRDEDFHYRLLLRADDWDGDTVTGVIWADGGIEVLADSCDLDGEDDYTVHPDRIEFELEADGTPDLLVFRASAQDWVAWIDSVATIPQVLAGATTYLPFEFEFSGLVPDRTRLAFTLWADGAPFAPTYSDFYLDIAAPRVVLNGARQAACTLDCPSPCPGCSPAQYQLEGSVRNLGSVEGEVRLVLDSVSGANAVCTPATAWFVVGAGEEEKSPYLRVCDAAPPDFVIDGLRLEWRVNGTEYVAEEWSDLDWATFPGAVSNVTVTSAIGGLVAHWDPPGSTTGVRGYHVYLDTDGTITKVTARPVQKAHIQLPGLERFDGLGDLIDYRIGVTAVHEGWTESSTTWSSADRHVSWAEREGWPKRMPRGSAKSVVAIDVDGDGDLEIIAAGQVLAMWEDDGTSATGEASGLLYDPYPTNEFDAPYLTFLGDIAVADVDEDDELEIAGSYGDNKLYLVDLDGDVESGFPIAFEGSKSTPVLADLDGDGDLEIIVQSFRYGNVYVFHHDGSSYSQNTTSGLFADPSAGNDFRFTSVAVEAIGDPEDELAVIQATSGGTIYAWKGIPSLTGNPATWWTAQPGYSNISTPVLADVDGDSRNEVILRAKANYFTVMMIETDPSYGGDRLRKWWGYYPASGIPGIDWLENLTVPPPAVGDLGGPETLEIAVSQVAGAGSWSPETWMSVAYLKPNDAPAFRRGIDEIPLPGRRDIERASTVTSPVLADFDDDGKVEILVGSDQGGLFAFEPEWAGNDTLLSAIPEPDWPMVFAGTPGNPVFADVDDDGTMELIVPTDDGYVHMFSMPGMVIEWGMAAGNPARTGGLEAPGSARPVSDGGVVSLLEHPITALSPNPFQESMAVRFQLPYAAPVGVAVYDAQGRRVRELIQDTPYAAGTHVVRWDGLDEMGRPLPAGAYFARVQMGERVETRKVVRMR